MVIKRLDDQELDRLVAAALGERARRKRPPLPDAGQKKEFNRSRLCSFAAGEVECSQSGIQSRGKADWIAKEFGLSRSEVESALKAMNAQK